MVAKRTTRPARATAAANKATRRSSKTSGTSAGKPSTKATTTARVAARKSTVSKTRKLVEAAPIVVDDGDDVARRKIAALRAAKARASDHRGRSKRSAVERAADPPAATGEALIARVSRAIERELTQIEVIVGGHHVAPRQRSEAERRARTLASLARTLREVTALRLSGKKEKREDDDAVPRDIGELRLALARRLDRLVADAKTAHPEGAD